MMNNSSNKPAATLDIQDHALPSSAAEAVTQALAPADLSPTESEQDALNGGCLGISCGGIKLNHNETLADLVDGAGADAAEAETQPEAPLDLSPTESEQDALNGGCLGISCGGIKLNHNPTLAGSVESTDEAEAESQPEAPLDLSPIESEQDALNGGCYGACGGIKFNHNQTLAESADTGLGG